MAGRGAAPLTKLPELVERKIVSTEMERRVQQHRRVTAREYDAIAVGPRWIRRIVLYVARPEHVREWRERHRRAGVTGIRRLDRVHGERADRIDAEFVEARVSHGGGFSLS
jgi:hypothetical protein